VVEMEWLAPQTVDEYAEMFCFGSVARLHCVSITGIAYEI
jgi:hypothetical protein